MTTNSLYTTENNKFITMLKLNYRAHPDVLKVPNILFYDNQLQVHTSFYFTTLELRLQSSNYLK